MDKTKVKMLLNNDYKLCTEEDKNNWWHSQNYVADVV